AAVWLFAADDQDKRPKAPQPNANITPRTKQGKEATPDSVLERRPDIRVDTNVVLIPVAVTDPYSRFVTGLEKENFKLYEEKVEQEIKQFSSEDATLSVGIVFDTRGSSGTKHQKLRQAGCKILKHVNADDRHCNIVF